MIDALDLKLITGLRSNGRRTNTDLARELGVTEGTVRKKIAKLTSAGVLKFVAVADPQKLGYVIDVESAVQVSPGCVVEAAKQLASLEVVRWVALATGSYDIMFNAMFRTQDELLEFLTKTLPSIPGVVRSETWHLLKVVKRNYDWFSPGESAY